MIILKYQLKCFEILHTNLGNMNRKKMKKVLYTIPIDMFLKRKSGEKIVRW